MNKDTRQEDWRFEKLGWNNSRDSYGLFGWRGEGGGVEGSRVV